MHYLGVDFQNVTMGWGLPMQVSIYLPGVWQTNERLSRFKLTLWPVNRCLHSIVMWQVSSWDPLWPLQNPPLYYSFVRMNHRQINYFYIPDPFCSREPSLVCSKVMVSRPFILGIGHWTVNRTVCRIQSFGMVHLSLGLPVWCTRRRYAKSYLIIWGLKTRSR